MNRQDIFNKIAEKHEERFLKYERVNEEISEITESLLTYSSLLATIDTTFEAENGIQFLIAKKKLGKGSDTTLMGRCTLGEKEREFVDLLSLSFQERLRALEVIDEYLKEILKRLESK